MKTYFATSLHDSEEIARMHMPNSSRPIPVHLSVDIKPDARGGRCACEWSGDALKVVCFAHLTAVREFDCTARAPAAEQAENSYDKQTPLGLKLWLDSRYNETGDLRYIHAGNFLMAYDRANDRAIAATQPAAERAVTATEIDRPYLDALAKHEMAAEREGSIDDPIPPGTDARTARRIKKQRRVVAGLRLLLERLNDLSEHKKTVISAIEMLEVGK